MSTVSLFYAIYGLADFLSDPFHFSSSKAEWTFSARRKLFGRMAPLEPYALLVSKYAVHQNCFEETASRCEEWFLVWKVLPLVRRSHLIHPTPISRHPRPPPPPSNLAIWIPLSYSSPAHHIT